jgi:cell division protein FtsL
LSFLFIVSQVEFGAIYPLGINTMADSQEKKWQDHPVVIAAGSVVAALIFAQTVIFPTMTASLQNELSSLRSQVQEITSLKDQLKKTQDDTKSEKQRMESEAKIEKSKLIASQITNIFSLGSPYPVGFGKVKLGDSINALVNTYPEAAINRTSIDHWRIKPDHPAFRDIAYFFDRPTALNDRRVRAILFFGDDRISGVLQDKLIEVLGQPALPGPKPECYIWTIDKSLFVKKDAPAVFALQNNSPDCKIPEK